jgi:hypothetical protein
LKTKKGVLTPMETIFVDHMARTGDRMYAARMAGYSSPQQAASKNLANVDVLDAMRRQAAERLRTEGAKVGVDVLITMANDDKQKGSTRVAAAKSLVQLSGIAGGATLTEQDLAEMPPEKMREMLARTEALLNERMAVLQTIDHEPLAIEAVDVFE